MHHFLDLLSNMNHQFSLVYKSRTGKSYMVKPVIGGIDPESNLILWAQFHVTDLNTGQEVNFGHGVNKVPFARSCGLVSDSEDDVNSMREVLFRATLDDLESRLDSFTSPFEDWEPDCCLLLGEESMPDYLSFRDKKCEYQEKVPGSLECIVQGQRDDASGATVYHLCNRCAFPEPPFRCEYLFVETLGSRAGGRIFSRNAFLSCGRGEDIREDRVCAFKGCFRPVQINSTKKFSAAIIPGSLEEAAERHEDYYLELKVNVDTNEAKNGMRKDIAAFSSCEGGVVYIGISDDGRLVGLPAGSSTEIDELKRKVFGIVRSNISPLPAVSIDIIQGNNSLVFARIIVFPGDAPIYYYNGIPYVRRGSSSVPATPEEVLEMAQSYLLMNNVE